MEKDRLSEGKERRIGIKCCIGDSQIVSRCEWCGLAIFLREMPGERTVICVDCAINDASQHDGDSVLVDMLLDNLRTMKQAGL